MTLEETMADLSRGIDEMMVTISDAIGTDWQELARKIQEFNAGLISAADLQEFAGLEGLPLDLPEPDVALPPLDWGPLREAMS